MAVSGPVTRNSAGTIIGNVTVCTDENYTVLDTDTVINLKTTGAGSRTLTFPTTAVQGSGRLLFVHMTALSTGTYATSGVVGGEVTFDADETFHIFVSEDGVGWHSMRLTDAAIATGEVTTAKIADAAVTPVKLGCASVAPAANAACALLATTTEVLLTVTDATNTAISTTSAEPGQQVMLRAVSVAGGGSYTLAVTTGTLTLNSTGETALIQRNVADTAWHVVSLCAGDAGGAAATIV